MHRNVNLGILHFYLNVKQIIKVYYIFYNNGSKK